MRRSLVLFFAIAAACTSAQEVAPIPPTTEPPATTITAPRPTSIPTPPSTTTTLEPTTTTTLLELQALAYEEVAALDFPIHLVEWRTGLSLVATKDGRIWVMEPDGEVRTTAILDITDQVTNRGEQGLLSIAVQGDDPGRVFAHYSGPGGVTIVSEFSEQDGCLLHEREWLRVSQPASNHNGGMIQFGPDGRLYLGLGDGGGSNDRFGNGQDTGTLLGGLVAIDVDAATAELFSYGLRNPWRFWIEDDLVYIADVGQNAFEEVSVSRLSPGTNYGWPVTEGLHCFSPSSGCDTGGQTLPVVEVRHGDGGTCSITGGVVYRGAEIPEIHGHYFYSDFCGGYLRSFRYGDGEVAAVMDWTDQVGVPGSVTSFGVDFIGEMYVLTTNRVLKVVAVRG